MSRPPPKPGAPVQHPGPIATDRTPHAYCHAFPMTVEIPAGQPLTQVLGKAAEAHGAETGFFYIDGLDLAPFTYVSPAVSPDDRHAAWYSDERHRQATRITDGIVVLGHKEGDWFLHIHAELPEDPETGQPCDLGHLLPHTVMASKPCRLHGVGVKGAAFVAAFEPETEFTLFRLYKTRDSAPSDANAILTTIAPNEDVCHALSRLSSGLDQGEAKVIGLGSLITAAFHDAPPMTSPISEIFFGKQAQINADGTAHLPVKCANAARDLHFGCLKPGAAPSLITVETLIWTPGLT
ncbi:hypothetical protein E2K80_03535 [Rhodophyticola sp. CCM32]|uniref:hypothetical protein n=1 Tax=Rhodophyticola sp. CCM32 TaxID=2916397 RepID=UPI00107F9786|nr:hypothetical protein [Rhodophyticola sp. CCM32]QBX99922.1 hypothetical protein E2K80_03535 [Rhodophyticola sp. CCM32]